MRRNRTWRFVGAATAAGALFAYGCTDEQQAPVPPPFVQPPSEANPQSPNGHDLNDFNLSPVTIDGAIWEFPAPANVGTGNIDPFLSIQNNPDEEGFNSDGTLYADSKRPQFTDALPLSNIPVIKQGDVLFREIIFDANESNSFPDAQFSIDRFDLWICLDEAPFTINTADDPTDFNANPNCQLIYAPFSPGDVGFATDAATQGSGQALDYRILIPNDAFDAFQVGQVTIDDCPYNPLAPPCGLWVILHAEMGHFGGDWITNATFDEFSTVLQPFVQIQKTAVPEFTRTYTWEIEKSVDPEDIYLFEGQSQDADWTVVVTQTGSEDSEWMVSGSVTITNPSEEDATITDITDLLQPGNIPIDLDCGQTGDILLASGDDLVCTYTHVFGSDPGATEFTNTVEVELEGLAITTGESESFAFGAPTTEVNKTVDVEDLLEGLLASGISTGDTFEYSTTYTCDQDEGAHNNVAQVIGDGGQVLDEDDATTTVHCLDVDVTKDAETALERTYLWEIDKSVTPETWDLFVGDDGTSDYDVTVTPNGFTDADWMVDGTISITNPNAVSVFIQGVSDEISGGIAATVDCGVTFPHELAAGATLQCSYDAVLPDGSERTNTATVEAKPTEAGASKDFTGDAAVSFAGVTLTEVNKVINVDDTFAGDLGSANHDDGPTTFEYSRTFTCGADEGQHDNTATIVETGQSDDASVTVNCYDLEVTKDAATTFTRTWNWTIDKVIDPDCFLEGTYNVTDNEATVQENEVLEVCYEATIDASSTDSEFHVSEGANGIVIHNNHPSLAATLTSVEDVVSPAIAASVSCPALTVPAGGDLTCTYDADLPDATERLNTATATQQNFSYASDGGSSPSGTTQYSGNAAVVFDLNNPTLEIDECVDVDDAIEDALGVEVGSTSFGTYCADQPLPHTFEYSYLFGPGGIPLECDDNRFINTASFITNDTGTEDSDDAEINIFVECEDGCTLTQGYWKTHNETRIAENDGHGPPPDPTWELLGDLDVDGTSEAEGELFFNSGQTWYEVFWTPPQGGNVYYTLAHQYMAAYLNLLAGASAPAEVTAAMSAAETLFNTYNPDDQLRGRDGNEVRHQFIELAGILASYNEGLIGPGHCTENGES